MFVDETGRDGMGGGKTPLLKHVWRLVSGGENANSPEAVPRGNVAQDGILWT